MSNAVFPSLPGLKWSVSRTPMFKTGVRETASGREYRTRYQVVPRYRYMLAYEFLRDRHLGDELRQLLGFFNQRQGSFDTFLFSDPDDCSVSAQAFGIGDGASNAFQLVRTLGGFVEPVYDLDGTPSLYKDGVLLASGYSVSASGVVTFTAAPAAGAVLTWSGNFFWRCRFRQDSTQFEQFAKRLWEAKQVEFITVKP